MRRASRCIVSTYDPKAYSIPGSRDCDPSDPLGATCLARATATHHLLDPTSEFRSHSPVTVLLPPTLQGHILEVYEPLLPRHEPLLPLTDLSISETDYRQE